MKAGQKITMTNYHGVKVETFISWVGRTKFSIDFMGKKKFDISRWEQYFVPIRNAKFI